jgi:hypothetical protein
MTGANLHKIIEALRRAGVTIEDDGVRPDREGEAMKIALIILIALIWNCIDPPVNFALIASLLMVNAVGHHGRRTAA